MIKKNVLDLESAPDEPLPREVARSLAPRPQGRPLKFTEEIASRILESIAQGSFLTAAAAEVGLDVQTPADWLRRGLGDGAAGLDTGFSRFAEAFAQAQAAAENGAVAVLQRGGDGKYKDWRAQAWWLERRHKDRWSLPKEQASQGLTLQLTNEQLAALSEALRVGAATVVSPTTDVMSTPLVTTEKDSAK